jgi:hypothetical protein
MLKTFWSAACWLRGNSKRSNHHDLHISSPYKTFENKYHPTYPTDALNKEIATRIRIATVRGAEKVIGFQRESYKFSFSIYALKMVKI